MRSREATDWKTGRKGLTKEISGTGLGLWVSYEIIQRHGGTLAVRSSRRKGRSGTVFTLFLPFEAVVR